jgi:membrane associated rhomboid family serine protease
MVRKDTNLRRLLWFGICLLVVTVFFVVPLVSEINGLIIFPPSPLGASFPVHLVGTGGGVAIAWVLWRYR